MSRADTATATRIAVPRVASTPIASTRVAFLDHIRYLMVVLVVVYHAVAAYATVAPHWPLHDASFPVADMIREILDVSMMPVLFFVAGYLALPNLERKGVWGFLKDKGKRLLIPWFLAVLVFIPLLIYDRPDQLVRPFREYWLWYLGNFKTGLSFLPQTQSSQMVYWFISLLFAFFALFALAHTVVRRRAGRAGAAALRKPTRGHAPLATLMLFGVLTAAGYLAGLLLFPDSSWFSLGVFLQFQPTRLVLFAGYFALGVYAQSQGWFASGKPLGSLALWGAASVALAAAFLVAAQAVLADPAQTLHLPVLLLAAFAVSRSLLGVALLIVLVSFGVRYWNRSSGLDRALAETSYNIYLTHFWFVVAIQEHLVGWTGSPLLKFAIVLLAALPLSFAVSRWLLGRWPRGFAVAIMALFVFCLAVRP